MEADDYDREAHNADDLDFADDTWSGFKQSYDEIEATSLKHGLR